MVDKFKEILEELRSQKGEVTLFAVLKMDELTDKWTVVVAAPWINPMTKNDVFSFLRDIMIQKFTPEEMSSVARLGIFPDGEHIVQELLKFKVGAIISEDEEVNGNIIHVGYILASKSI